MVEKYNFRDLKTISEKKKSYIRDAICFLGEATLNLLESPIIYFFCPYNLLPAARTDQAKWYRTWKKENHKSKKNIVVGLNPDFSRLTNYIFWWFGLLLVQLHHPFRSIDTSPNQWPKQTLEFQWWFGPSVSTCADRKVTGSNLTEDQILSWLWVLLGRSLGMVRARTCIGFWFRITQWG